MELFDINVNTFPKFETLIIVMGGTSDVLYSFGCRHALIARYLTGNE